MLKLLTEAMLLQVLEATAPYTGDDFFHHLTLAIAHACGTRWGFVAELLIDTSRVRLVSCSQDGDHLSVSEYDVAGTPCAETVAGGRSAYETNVAKLFPLDVGMTENDVQAYVAVSLRAASGDIIGLYGVSHDKALPSGPILTLLDDLAPRVAAELERRQVEYRYGEARPAFASWPSAPRTSSSTASCVPQCLRVHQPGGGRDHGLSA